MCVGSLAGVTYLRYTVLTSPNKGETAVHCCDPPLSVLVMLVSRNVFHVVSALQSIVFLYPSAPQSVLGFSLWLVPFLAVPGSIPSEKGWALYFCDLFYCFLANAVKPCEECVAPL